MRWTDHEQFSNEGRLQQRYVLKLRVPVPDELLAELNEGATQRADTPTQTRPRTGPTNRPGIWSPRTRRPATLDEYHRAFRYALGTLEREVVAAHQHYQMRLRAHLEAQGVLAEWERDFIDVRWERGGVTWIGEVKLTRYLSAAEAFRTALGQLLVYGATHFSKSPRMVMFLDQSPGERLLRLADTLGIAVVVETTPGVFELRSAPTDFELGQLFTG